MPPAICNCDLDLGHTKLKCKLARDIAIIIICAKIGLFEKLMGQDSVESS